MKNYLLLLFIFIFICWIHAEKTEKKATPYFGGAVLPEDFEDGGHGEIPSDGVGAMPDLPTLDHSHHAFEECNDPSHHHHQHGGKGNGEKGERITYIPHEEL